MHCYTEAKKGFTGGTSCPQDRYMFSIKYSKYLSEAGETANTGGFLCGH